MQVKEGIRTSNGKLTNDGCRFSTSCLTCPLPRCKDEMTADEIRQHQGPAQRQRNRQVQLDQLRAMRKGIMDAFERNRSANPDMDEFWVEWLAARETGVNRRMVEITRAREG